MIDRTFKLFETRAYLTFYFRVIEKITIESITFTYQFLEILIKKKESNSNNNNNNNKLNGKKKIIYRLKYNYSNQELS